MAENTVKLKVDGMSCMHCVNNIKTVVGQIKGIDTVEVDLENGIVTVTRTDDQSVDFDEVRAAIEDEGYEVRS